VDAALFPVIVGGMLVVVGLLIYLGWKAEQKRIAEVKAYAARRGWSYTERDDSWHESFTGSPFHSGHGRRSTKVLRGPYDGREAAVFDFVYHTTETSTDANGHSHSREESHHFNVVALSLGATTPGLSVSPEGAFGRLLGRMFNSDIELESEEFNRAFTVTADDRKFASDVLHPRMMELLLQHRDTAWRIDRGWLLTVERGTYELPDVDQRLDFADRLLDALPDFLRRQYGIPAPTQQTGGAA
jgi:hypothetical protein